MLTLVGSIPSKCPDSGGPSVMYEWGLGGLPVVAAKAHLRGKPLLFEDDKRWD
jgi:hypothetical protein